MADAPLDEVLTTAVDVLGSTEPYDLLARLRSERPVCWVPELGAWFVTRRDLAYEVMRDADTFTVDDPRFSTAAVLGPSMLSMDGPEHERHRSAFTHHFRPSVLRPRLEEALDDEARALVGGLVDDGQAELRTALAGPLAVSAITRFLGLVEADPADVLRWYTHIADAIVGAATGAPIGPDGRRAVDQIHERVRETVRSDAPSLLADLKRAGALDDDELATETAVILFGAIETSEGMTANALWHLLGNPELVTAVSEDRDLVPLVIEESLRIEPAAASIDRYTTRTVDLGGVRLGARDMVTVSLLAANRDPSFFPQPDRFDIARPNVRGHLSFVQGPHACIGLHLARLETSAALHAVLDLLPHPSLDRSSSVAPQGLIFRKPPAVVARWQPPPAPPATAGSTER